MGNNFSEEVQRNLKDVKKDSQKFARSCWKSNRVEACVKYCQKKILEVWQKVHWQWQLAKRNCHKSHWRVCQWWQLAWRDCHKSYQKACHWKLQHHWIFFQTNSLPCLHVGSYVWFFKGVPLWDIQSALFNSFIFFHFWLVEGIPDPPMLHSSSIFTLHKIWSTQPPKIPSRLKKCKPYH